MKIELSAYLEQISFVRLELLVCAVFFWGTSIALVIISIEPCRGFIDRSRYNRDLNFLVAKAKLILKFDLLTLMKPTAVLLYPVDLLVAILECVVQDQEAHLE